MRVGVAQRVLFAFECLVLVGVRQRGELELVHLEAVQVDLAGPGARVSPELGPLRVDVGDRSTRIVQRSEVDARERIEDLALDARRQQRLVGVLAVQVHQAPAPLGKLAGGGRASVHVGARSTRSGDHPRQDHLAGVIGPLALGEVEPAVDPRLGRARSHHRRVGTPSHEQFDRIHEHRLAGARLTGERGHPGTEDEPRLGYDAQVAHHEFGQHQRTTLVTGR